MNVTLQIPDDIASRLNAGGDDLSRRALEAFAVEEYRHDRLTHRKGSSELRRAFQLDEFLRTQDVWIEYTREGAEHERKGLERLGF